MTKPLPPVRWSNLRRMAQSPAHYRYAVEYGTEPTTTMNVGAIAHAMLLGGMERFALYDGPVRRGKAFESFAAEYPDCQILIRSEWDAATAIVEAVRANKEAMRVLDDGEHERRIHWQIAGRDCHGTPDVLGSGITDLKITNTADPRRFPWHARKMLWHAQLAWYALGAMEADLIENFIDCRHSIVAVESKPPFPVVVYDLTPQAAEFGRRTWRALWERLRVCEENDHWPGYVEGIALLDVPEDETATIVMDGEEIEV